METNQTIAMSAQHTPGPWVAHQNGHNRIDIWEQAENKPRVQIGEVYTGGSNKNNPGYANARLIVAVPEISKERDELRKLIKRVHYVLHDFKGSIGPDGPELMRELDTRFYSIAKAEGRA